MLKRLPAELRTHLKTWVQGTLHFKEAQQCKWHQGQQHKPMPPEWADRILARDEKNHSGTQAGFLWNHKSITNTHIHTKVMENGKIYTSCHPANIKAGPSRWMQHHPPMTHAARCGSLVFVCIISPWANSSDWLPLQDSQSRRIQKPELSWPDWLHLHDTPTPQSGSLRNSRQSGQFGRTPTREPHTKTSWSKLLTRTTRESRCCTSVATLERPKHLAMSHNSAEDKETQHCWHGRGQTTYMTRSSQNGNRCLKTIT